MKIVHVCNNYFSSRVHQNLSSALVGKVSGQVFLVPIKGDVDVGVYDRSTLRVFRYPRFLRYFPFVKCLYVFVVVLLDPVARSAIRDADRVVAHNFWSDGVVSFFLSFFFKFKFLLVIRNTDINIFIPKLVHYRWLMRLMIRASVSVVFVSKAYEFRFKSKFSKLYREMDHKCVVIPNGIDKYWIDNRIEYREYRPESILYVGRFVEVKNLDRLIEACALLKRRRPGLTLTLVGGYVEELVGLVGKQPPVFVRVVESIKERSLLIKYYRSARVFAMPSLGETFGLTYIEAISQGCSIICSQGEGVDGMFSPEISLAANPLSVESIALAIDRMCQKNPKGISVDLMNDCIHLFDWDAVADMYIENLI